MLDEATGGEFQSFLRAGVMPDAEFEEHRQRDPSDRPADGFAEGDDLRLAMEHAEVHRQHERHEEVETDPEPDLLCQEVYLSWG